MSFTIVLLYILFGILVFISFEQKTKLVKKFYAEITVRLFNKNGPDPQQQQPQPQPQQHDHNLCKTVKTVWDIPGPRRFWLIGTKWIFFWRYRLNKLQDAYKDFLNRYGKIALETTGSGVPIVHLFDRHDIEQVLRYPSKYPFRPPTEIVAMYRLSRPDRYSSTGLVNEQGEKWLHLRATLTPHITSPRVIAAFVPALNLIGNDFVQLIKAQRDTNGIVHNFHEIANLMGLEAMCMLLLGQRMGFLSLHKVQEANVVKLANAVKQLFIAQRDSYHGYGFWKYFPSQTYASYVRSEETIHSIISEYVDAALNEEELNCSINDNQSVFLNILHIPNLDVREKKSAIVDFIAAGIETFANTFCFVLFYISSIPQAQRLICEEFPTGCSDGSGCVNCDVDDIGIQQLSNAYYTKACIQETYRISPTAMAIARVLEADMQLSGYHIEAGTVLLCHNAVASQCDRNFTNATVYDPTRWLTPKHSANVVGRTEMSKTNAHTSIVAPFGAGKRMCPGKRFVEVELTLMVAKLLSAFRIEYVSDLDPQFEFLLAPKTPVIIKFIDRNDLFAHD